METKTFKEVIKAGTMVVCTLITGQRAVGTYTCTKESTGTHLVENLTVEGGYRADYGWATTIEPAYA